MLARPYRLTTTRDIERASRGRPAHAPHLTVRAAWSGRPHTRVTIVAGLKVSKRANVRNLVKRRMREAIRRHWGAILPGADVVIHAKPTAVGIGYHTIAYEIGNALYRAKLLRSPWVDTLGTPRTKTGEQLTAPRRP